MPRNDVTSAIVDGILKSLVFGGASVAALVLPNSPQLFEKPVHKYLDKLDARSREREVRRVLRYMRQQGLIKYQAEGYQHGLVVTAKGRKRANAIDIATVQIKTPKKWDGKWRLVMFDIPEKYKHQRDMLSNFLRGLNFYKLQKSVWLHPYKCKEEVYAVSNKLGVTRFVTYIETSHIDKDQALKKRFFK